MDNFRDVYLEHALKKWISRRRPVPGLRSRLLNRVVQEHFSSSGILQAYILSSNQMFTWSFAQNLQGSGRYDLPLMGVRLVF